jgi:CHAD domain-containing protein
VDALCEASYVSLLNRLEQAVQKPRFAGSGSLSQAMLREHRRARKLVRRLPQHPSDRDLHEVRKAVKRARYAAELAAEVGAKGMRKYLKRAKDLQDVLGDHQDAVVASGVIAGLDADMTRPSAHMAVTALLERQHARQGAARAGFPKAWKRLDKRGKRIRKAGAR